MKRGVVVWLGVVCGFWVAGCHRAGSVPTAADLAEQRAELEDDRAELAKIPPPVKSQYMAVHGFENWMNPYLTVQSNVVELHVTRGDANPSTFGAGGMLRPVGARQAVLTLSMDKLDEALSAVPADAWPYGRVVAIEEAHHVPASAEAAVRKNLGVTLGMMNDLGVVTYDLAEGR